MRLKVHTAIARGLADHGVDTVFGLTGDGNLFIVDALMRDHGVRHISATHEGAATLMADGYARATGRLGVVTITHGPALTNTVTALTEAVRSRTPLLMICGDTPGEERQHLQDIVQRDVVLPTGAGFVQVRSARTAVEDLGLAIRRIYAERRPVALNVPIDLQWDEVDYERRVLDVPVAQRQVPDQDALDVAVGLIATAKRPIVLAGRGAAGARDNLVRLAERIGAPLATTLLAKGMFGDVPASLGVFGTLSHGAATEVITDSDLIVVFGAGLNRYTTSSDAFTSGKRIVHCDVEAGRIGQWVPVDAALVGDAGLTADTIVGWLDSADLPSTSFASAELIERLVGHDPTTEFTDRSTASTVDMRSAMIRLDSLLPADRTLVTDGGRFVHQALRYFNVSGPGSVVPTVVFGSIGLGMGAAVGAGIGRPDRPVVAVFGDGGFMMGGPSEFNSAVRHGVDLIAVVFNDSSYGAEHVQLRRRGMDPSMTLFQWPELAPLSEALGGRGLTVRNLGDLDLVEELVRTWDRPLLIDVKVDPEVLSKEV